MADCDWIVLCDYAFPAQNGKLCLIGIFDLLGVPSVPYQHDRAAICFSVIGEPGEHVHLKLDIIGPTGQHVIPTFEQTVTLPDAGGAQGNIELRGLKLKDFGRHAIQLDLGEGVPKTAWFTLKELPQSA